MSIGGNSVHCFACGRDCAKHRFECTMANTHASHLSTRLARPSWCPKCFTSTDCGNGNHPTGCTAEKGPYP